MLFDAVPKQGLRHGRSMEPRRLQLVPHEPVLTALAPRLVEYHWPTLG